MSNFREVLAKESETKVIAYLGAVKKPHLLVQHAAFDRVCIAYNRTGNVHVFLAEEAGVHLKERVDFDIACDWITDPVGLIYPRVAVPEFDDCESGDHAAAKALAKVLTANQVNVPSAPEGDDETDWQNYLDDLVELLKTSPAAKAMIRAELQLQAASVDYELLIEEMESQIPYED